jgi:fumarate hydratase class I
MEEKMLQSAYKASYGAQFARKYFALDVRIIRCRAMVLHALWAWVFPVPRIATSRRINRDGICWGWSEIRGGSFRRTSQSDGHVVQVDLNRPMREILAQLTKYP